MYSSHFPNYLFLFFVKLLQYFSDSHAAVGEMQQPAQALGQQRAAAPDGNVYLLGFGAARKPTPKKAEGNVTPGKKATPKKAA